MVISRTKKTYKAIRYATLTWLTAIVATAAALAQEPMPTQKLKEDFKEKELDCFLNANSKINQIQMAAQDEMVKIIEKEGISVEKFNEMAQSQQNPDSATAEPAPKEVESFQKAAEKITGMQQSLEEKMIKAVEGEGLEVETYMQIAQAYQQSPKVKKELDEMMKEKQAKAADTLTN